MEINGVWSVGIYYDATKVKKRFTGENTVLFRSSTSAFGDMAERIVGNMVGFVHDKHHLHHVAHEEVYI
jgi:hypothetical protein